MIYNCIFCNYSTNRVNNFTSHNETKRHKKNFDKCNLNEDINKIENIENKTKNDVDNEIDNEINIFTCDICSDIFKSKATYYRHHKQCKINYDNNKINETLKTTLKTAVDEMKSAFSEQIKELKPNIINNNKNKNNCHNTTNNITNNTNNTTNNTTNHITNHITLSYVETDVSHLTDNDFKRIVNMINYCVKELVCKKHFNIEKPENMNLCISNKKDAYMKVFMKDKWTSTKIDEMIHTLFEENEMEIEDWLTEFNDPLLNAKYQRYTKNKENKELKEELQTDLKQFMYDKTKELKIGRNKN